MGNFWFESNQLDVLQYLIVESADQTNTERQYRSITEDLLMHFIHPVQMAFGRRDHAEANPEVA